MQNDSGTLNQNDFGFEKCRCQHCNQSIEFPKDASGQIVECPNCKMETLLFIPKKAVPPPLPGVQKNKPNTQFNVAIAVISIITICFLMAIATNERSSANEISSSIAGAILGVLGIAIGAIIYFLPSLIARDKKKKNTQAIFTLNLLTGWTFIGWVVAIVWAVTKDD